MKHFQFTRKQLVKASISEVWNFISSPANLQKITPDHMGFEITSKDLPDKMYAGMIITYKINPVPMIPVNWVTEISQVQEGTYFVDEQRVGPYALWHHQHILEDHPEGTMMTDVVTYSPPFGFIGTITNSIFIKRKLRQIFAYRSKALTQLYP